MEPIQSIDAEDDQFAYRYDTQLLIDRRDEDLDEDEIINAKMDKNEAKYPVEKARGSAAKYTEL